MLMSVCEFFSLRCDCSQAYEPITYQVPQLMLCIYMMQPKLKGKKKKMPWEGF